VTEQFRDRLQQLSISIHTLRVEGDDMVAAVGGFMYISIHTLRVEGDQKQGLMKSIMKNFNPHPPGGG